MKKQFSWEKPIEEEILEFVRSMAVQMETVALGGMSEVQEGAKNMATAYRTVEEHILQQKEIRK